MRRQATTQLAALSTVRRQPVTSGANLTGILGTDPQDFVREEVQMYGSIAPPNREGDWKGAKPLPRKKSLEMTCFVNSVLLHLLQAISGLEIQKYGKIWGAVCISVPNSIFWGIRPPFSVRLYQHEPTRERRTW